MVQGSIEKGAPIVFFIDGKQAEVFDVAAGGQWQETYPFKPGRVTNLNLRVNTALSDLYYITTSSGNGGVIGPGGVVEVVPGSAVTFTITANPGYKIQNVLVDGESKGVPATYTFTNVTSNHTLSATFTTSGSDGSGTYYITASSGDGGVIEPGGVVEVVPGSAVTFTITASPGYKIQDVLVDGESKGVLATYTFTNVTSNHTLSDYIHLIRQRWQRLLLYQHILRGWRCYRTRRGCRGRARQCCYLHDHRESGIQDPGCPG